MSASPIRPQLTILGIVRKTRALYIRTQADGATVYGALKIYLEACREHVRKHGSQNLGAFADRTSSGDMDNV